MNKNNPFTKEEILKVFPNTKCYDDSDFPKSMTATFSISKNKKVKSVKWFPDINAQCQVLSSIVYTYRDGTTKKYKGVPLSLFLSHLNFSQKVEVEWK